MKKETNPKSYHHKDLKEQVIRQTIAFVSESGFENLSLRKIAAQTGVAHTALYHHFKNKEDLLADTATTLIEEFMINIRNSNEKYGKEPYQQLFNYGYMYIEYAWNHKNLFRLMFGNHQLDPLKFPRMREVSGDAMRYLIELIVHCQKLKLVKKGPPLQIAMAIRSITHGYATLLVDNRISALKDYGFDADFSIKELNDFIFEVLKNGILIETKKFFL